MCSGLNASTKKRKNKKRRVFSGLAVLLFFVKDNVARGRRGVSWGSGAHYQEYEVPVRCGSTSRSLVYFLHEDAGAHCDEMFFFLTILRTHNSNPYVSETYDCFHFRSMSSKVAHFPSFPKKNGKCAKEETAARSFRPKIWRPSADGMKLARCARSDSHSVRALRAAKSCPCGAGLHSNGRGAAPALSVSCIFSMHIPNVHLSLSGGADSHTWQNVSCIVRGHACLANFPAQQVRKFKGGARIPPPRAPAFGLCARPICPRKCSAASSACILPSLVRMKSGCYTKEKQKKSR